MSSDQSESMVFDTSVLIDLALDSPTAQEMRDGIIGGRVHPFTGELNLAELYYVLCRRAGERRAATSVGLLRRSSQVRILPASTFIDSAARMKCSRRISLVDCITLAMGESLSLPVLFARREKELDSEMKREPFGTKLLFLEGD